MADETAVICQQPSTSPHPMSAHQSNLPHNPWSLRCSKGLPGEPTCPEAWCWTCDGTRAEVTADV